MTLLDKVVSPSTVHQTLSGNGLGIQDKVCNVDILFHLPCQGRRRRLSVVMARPDHRIPGKHKQFFIESERTIR
jgi:hypothetical protein